MKAIYEMDAFGRLTGNTRQVGEYDGAPAGWTFSDPPTDNLADWQWAGSAYVPAGPADNSPAVVEAPADVPRTIAALMSQVDDLVAASLTKVTRFSIGYEQREAAARDYKEAGYEGDPTIWITRFADNTGMPYKVAADLIISQADHLREALKEMEAFRMDKYRIKACTDVASAQEAYAEIEAGVRAIAATL